MKKYKIYRFVKWGENEVRTIDLPDDLELYCINPDSTIEYSGYINHSYVGICKANKKFKTDDCLDNMDVYRLPNDKILVFFDQICPISNDFPVTVDAPVIEPFYLKFRSTHVGDMLVHKNEDIQNRINELSKILYGDEDANLDELNSLSKQVVISEYLDLLNPVYGYAKVNGIIYDEFDITFVRKYDSITGMKSPGIYRCCENFSIIDEHPWQNEKCEFITSEEYEVALQETINQL